VTFRYPKSYQETMVVSVKAYGKLSLTTTKQYIGWSDVAAICGHNTISMVWGNMAYCVKLSSEDLSHYWNKTESLA